MTNTEVANLSHFAIIVRKSHCQPQRTLQLVSEQRVLCVWVDLRVSLSGQQYPKCEREIRAVYPSCFCNLCSSSNPTNKNLKELDLEVQTTHFDNHSELDTCPCEHFYHSAWYYNALFPNINFSSWITLYNASIQLIRFFKYSPTAYFHTDEMLFTLKVKSKFAGLVFTKILSPQRNYMWHFCNELHTNQSVITESMGRNSFTPVGEVWTSWILFSRKSRLLDNDLYTTLIQNIMQTARTVQSVITDLAQTAGRRDSRGIHTWLSILLHKRSLVGMVNNVQRF